MRESPVRAEPHPTSSCHPAVRREPPQIDGSIGRPIPLGMTFLGEAARGAPVRAEPHPTRSFAPPNTYLRIQETAH
jgi:hypothetical protein